MNPTRRVGRARPRPSVPSALLLAALAVAAPAPLAAQQAPAGDGVVGGPGSANYRLAARWAPYKLDELLHSTSVDPRWIEGTERFWYEWETTDGKRFMIVDPVAGTRREIFDVDWLAAELTRIVGDPYDGQHLPIRSIRFIDGNTVEFEVESSLDEEEDDGEEGDTLTDGDTQQEEGRRGRDEKDKKVHHFRYEIDTNTLTELEDWEEPDDHPDWASVSPDGQWVVFARNHDLHMMSGADYERILDARRGKDGAEADTAAMEVEVDEIRLTEDGVEHWSWQSGGADRGDTDQEREKSKGDRKSTGVLWSKDSRRLAVVRQDQREVKDLWVIHSTGNERPELETYRYDMPGEEHVTQNQLWVVDLETRAVRRIDDTPWQDQDMSVLAEPRFFYPDSEEPRTRLWAGESSDELWFVRDSRDRKKRDLVVANPTTGAVRVVVEERANTALQDIDNPDPRLLPNGDVLWWSERDGWGHLYRFASDGSLRNRLTSGPWHVDDIEAVDETAGVVYLVGNGREEGEDPYYAHLYRVGLDGTGLRMLSPGDADHQVDMGESTRFFVDNHSRVNTVPSSTLRNARGEVVLELEEADFSRMAEAGWAMPEPFTVKADDGITDLYGVMYKPFDFDPAKTYPVVLYVYPGPQTEAVSKSFSTSRYETALAQFGFIVVTVGNRGGHPDRSKWYHAYGYGNLRDYGLADKKATIEQLADRHDFVDIDRVGIYGHSGGGFMSTAAMLVYPDLFDVAVSSSGNHTNEVYNRWWSETHHGVKEVVSDSGTVSFEYEIASNPELAKNLKGHLLLTTGDIDNNVHHANTLRMARALIEANKRFDYFVFPGQRHGYGSMGDYWFWLRAEYFVRHLLGDDRWDADIVELQVEEPRRR